MNTIKGFTKEEVRVLAERAQAAKENNQKLSAVFEGFAKDYGRAKGSVRNFYYDFIKMCARDEALSSAFFKTPPSANKIRSFDEGETRFLVRKILIGKKLNKSVRRTIIELSGGDEKLMLRYQNKYRNVVKNQRGLIREIADELGMEEDALVSGRNQKVPDITLKQLKTSINSLVEGIARAAREEKQALSERNRILEAENAVLREVLRNRISTERSFSPPTNEAGKKIIN
ncbi:MAG: hypothetical protein IKC36_05760 [Clostridia bacterium]|nr:hypothetical protein [Clostridia bacterium]